MLLKLKVLVDVDGEQHDSKAYHGTHMEVQWERDRAHDLAAVREGFHVVRLSGTDLCQWEVLMCKVLTEIRSHPSPPRTYIYPSYCAITKPLTL